MHIPDAVLSPPVAAATGALALGGYAYCLKRLERRLTDRTSVLMGVLAAFVFAAQMVNFPLVVLPASGHLIGSALAVVMIGPWAGAVVIAAVLIVQCLLFADGGLLALGANTLNLGLIAGLGAYAIYDPIRRAIGGHAGVMIGAMAAAWFSVLLAAGAFSVELAASGRWSEFAQVLGWMALVHAVIGLGEALITGLVLRAVLSVRPDLVPAPEVDFEAASLRERVAPGRLILGGLAVSIAVAVFLAPLASPLDDGLEYVGGRLEVLEEAEPVFEGPMPDYRLPGLPDVGWVTAAAGVIGTVTVFLASLVLARAVAWTRRAQELAAAGGGSGFRADGSGDANEA